jgi:TetR/AcrR family transcriptional regulator, lmrAB and yxaGH operons repressor
MSRDTKPRMIEATVESLRRHGVEGTSFTEVLKKSGAARGAIYHHFPGGKSEMTEAAVRVHGEQVAKAMGSLGGTSAAEVVDAFLELVRPVVLESVEGAGCAVAAVTNGSESGSDLQRASRDAFRSWNAAVAKTFREVGLDRTAAQEWATLLCTTLEGTQVLCRAERAIRPFDEAARTLRSLSAPV